jgi:hypothetical protein
MKHLVTSLLVIFSLNASALEVVASGFGKDYNESLLNAKISALDSVNGAWIHGDSKVRDGMFSEKITQYNGGVITKYEVLRNDGVYVVIKANVEPRSNKMITNTKDVSALRSSIEGHAEAYQRKQTAVKAIDDRNKAFAMKVEKVEYENQGKTTKVTMVVDMSYQEKWIADYNDLHQLAGDIELGSFYPPLRMVVNGMDGDKVRTSNVVRVNSDLALYDIVGNRVRVNAKESEKLLLTFYAESDKLTSVDSFVITF